MTSAITPEIIPTIIPGGIAPARERQTQRVTLQTDDVTPPFQPGRDRSTRYRWASPSALPGVCCTGERFRAALPAYGLPRWILANRALLRRPVGSLPNLPHPGGDPRGSRD